MNAAHPLASLVVVLLFLSTGPRAASAQAQAQAWEWSYAAEQWHQSQPGGGSLALEALGGTVGSALGMAVVGISARCGAEDLGCLIKAIGAAGALGVVGATAGTLMVAKHNNAPRSTGGAVAGALLGTGVALGVHYLVNNNTDRDLDDATFIIPLFAVAQGTFAAIGSRIAGRRGR